VQTLLTMSVSRYSKWQRADLGWFEALLESLQRASSRGRQALPREKGGEGEMLFTALFSDLLAGISVMMRGFEALTHRKPAAAFHGCPAGTLGGVFGLRPFLPSWRAYSLENGHQEHLWWRHGLSSSIRVPGGKMPTQRPLRRLAMLLLYV